MSLVGLQRYRPKRKGGIQPWRARLGTKHRSLIANRLEIIAPNIHVKVGQGSAHLTHDLEEKKGFLANSRLFVNGLEGTECRQHRAALCTACSPVPTHHLRCSMMPRETHLHLQIITQRFIPEPGLLSPASHSLKRQQEQLNPRCCSQTSPARHRALLSSTSALWEPLDPSGHGDSARLEAPLLVRVLRAGGDSPVPPPSHVTALDTRVF